MNSQMIRPIFWRGIYIRNSIVQKFEQRDTYIFSSSQQW